MKELSSNEIKQVNGGIFPMLIYVAGQYLAIYNMYKLAERNQP